MKPAKIQWYLRHWVRPFLAFIKMRECRTLRILFVLFLGIVVCSTLDIYLHYRDPRTGEPLDLGTAIYAIFLLLVFETPLAFPDSWITRVAFFAVPISGLILLGQGLIRIGSALLNQNRWSLAMASTYKDHTIVCGLGKVGFKVVRWVLDLKEEVVVLETNPNNPLIEEVRGWGVPVVIGDATRPETLKGIAIERAESIVPCTSDDMINLAIALEARRMVPRLKIVVRMFDMRMATNIRDAFNIHTAFSIPEIAAPAFAAAATRVPLDHAIAYGEGTQRSLLTITKFTLVPESTLAGYSVGKLEREFSVAVLGHRRGDDFHLHPGDDVVLEAGDRFIVSASIEALNRLATLTPPTREYNRYQKGQWRITAKTAEI